MHRKTVLAVVVLVVLAGCGGAGSDGGGAGESPETNAGGDDGADAGDSSTNVEVASDGSSSVEAQAKIQQRYRIKTAHVELQVDDYEDARSTLVSKTRALGGYVQGEQSDRHTRANDSWTTGTLVLRVPAEDYDELMTAVERSGTVEHRESDTTDVTERVVDLRARLDNLRVQRDRLRDLYDDANETEDVLAVGQRLSEVQGEIERVEGQLQVLEDRIAYSTVHVELHEEPPEEQRSPEEPAWYETGVVAAFLESVDGVVVLGRMFVVGLAYAAPYVLAVGLPVAGLYGAARRVS